ncbi:hypothetical protein J4422_00380 [Candidatus Pacearchaeota archaeon]|nr:hypothetical protein [Candidatus Pacearchaeota archaeon]
MIEKLVRGELPIQSIYQRDEAVTATVPIHLSVMDLPISIRIDVSLIEDAKNVIKSEYNQDMEYYLDILKQNGTDIPSLRGYEVFKEDWKLGAEPDNSGFLSLFWRENGDFHSIRFNRVPVVLSNRHDESGQFYTPESFRQSRWIEIIYRNITDPEIVAISPEKLRRYGKESEIARIDEEKGLAEVLGHAFSSDYHMNMAKTLLLRNFGVFYLNRLLDNAI